MRSTIQNLSRNCLLFIILITLAALSGGCKKKSTDTSGNNTNNNTVPARNTKYEITGNYSGKVTVVYNNQSGTSLSETYVSLPWTKEFVADNSVLSVGFGASTTSTSTLGVAGQTLTAKIYINGTETKSVVATADLNGHISFSGLVHTF